MNGFEINNPLAGVQIITEEEQKKIDAGLPLTDSLPQQPVQPFALDFLKKK